MRLILGCCFVLTASLAAQEPANRLTPKAVTDGWLLLYDGESTFGWKALGDGAAMKSERGALVITGPGYAFPTVKPGPFHLTFEYQQTASDGKLASCHVKDGTLSKKTLDASDTWKPFELKATQNSGHPFTLDLPKGATLSLRNVQLKPMGLASIFNGKDLTGWKIFPEKKSKFTVVDGAINIKDGPGDLQTESTYANFVLQLECISNGKHLNSGVFFRCRPNEYQNGYEAQIRNQFTAEPTQEYTIEEYDPKTHELLAKKKIQSTAFDFGTGAIYRRIPARKQVAKDGEWFTMTIVAHGNHFATFVNGIHVTDWTDNRPPSDNARTGYKQSAGHISLQGHDPTTDLSFRNFRIAEIATK